jgi:hypothetical protein
MHAFSVAFSVAARIFYKIGPSGQGPAEGNAFHFLLEGRHIMVKYAAVSCLSAGLLFSATASTASAAFDPSVIGPIVNHWQFSEANGTPLTGAQDSAGTSSWIYDIGYNPTLDIQSSTVQNGAFQMRRPGAGYYVNSYAPVGSSGLASDKLYLVADITWDYTNSTSGADARFGFHNATAGENTTSPTTGTPPVTILSDDSGSAQQSGRGTRLAGADRCLGH